MVDWEKLRQVASTLFTLVLIGFIVFWMYLAWRNFGFTKTTPYDDLETHITEIKCSGRSCNLTFDADIKTYTKVASTGSMVPLVGGGDWVVCLDAEQVKPKLGEFIITPFALHQVVGIETVGNTSWYLTKGWNNPTEDPYKVPEGNVKCVVAVIGR